MAKLVLNTPNLFQVYIADTKCPQRNILFVFSNEPFSAHVEEGRILVNNEPTFQCYFDVLPVYETLDYSLINQPAEDASITPLLGVSCISYDIDENDIVASDIKFRRILPWSVYDLSEIQYNGIKYKGIKHQ